MTLYCTFRIAKIGTDCPKNIACNTTYDVLQFGIKMFHRNSIAVVGKIHF